MTSFTQSGFFGMIKAWLLIVDINAVEQLYMFNDGCRPEASWTFQYCVLRIDEQMIRHHPNQGEVSQLGRRCGPAADLYPLL